MRRIPRPARIALIAGVAGLGWWWIGTLILHAFLFHPRREALTPLPPDVERVTYGDGVVGFFVHARSPVRTVVFFHGNAGVAAHGVAFARSLADEGADVLLAEYRGYGESEGTPSAHRVAEDGEAAVRYLLAARQVDPARLVVIGQSLGGAVGVQVLSHHRLAGGVLISTFTTLHDVSRAMLGIPLSWTVPDAWALDSESAIHGVRAPLLFVHGDADRLIPLAVGRALYEAAPGPKTWLAVRGGTHDLDDADAWATVRRFRARL